MLLTSQRTLITLVVCCCLPVAEAQDRPLETMTVTATRTPETASESLSSVTVIDRSDIETKQAQTLPDALRGIAGLDIANQGGPGQLTSFFLRGTESDHVLVMIDGVKVGSATTSLTQFENIPIDQVERIEVVRGPRASLYGSEAIGGVIQIFTRKGRTESFTPHASIGVSAGDIDSLKGSAGVSGSYGNGWYSVNFAGYGTSGINACDPANAGSGGCFAMEPDDDSSDYGSGSFRAGYDLGEDASLDINYLRTDGFAEFDGTFQNETDFSNQVFGTRLRFRPLDRWHVSLSGGQSTDETLNFIDGSFASQFETTRRDVSFQNDIDLLPGHLLTLGYDYLQDEVDSSTPFAVDTRNNSGYFAQYQATIGRFDMQASLRHDDNEQFGGYTTGGAALGFAFTRSLRLVMSYGTAFKAPSFNDLFFPGFGNPDLDPETSESYEISLRGQYTDSYWSLSAYQTDIDDLIGTEPLTFQAINVNKARIRGLEATAGTNLYGFDIKSTLTLLDPENRSPGPNFGNDLNRRAEYQFNLDIDRRMGRFNAGGSIYFAGSRYDDLANEVELDSYVLVDLRGEYRFDDSWQLQTRVANLLDEDYETARFFNQPGRSVFLTLRYQPQTGY